MDFSLLAVATTVVVAHFIALVSPGPDFLLIVKSTMKNTKRTALGVAFGIALANGLYIALCIVGVGAILTSSLIVMTVLKILGGLFLMYVAYQALLSKRSDYAFINEASDANTRNESSSFAKESITGFISGISNPKNVIFYLSLFSVVLTNDISLWFKVGLGVWMTALVFFWDAFIVIVLSQKNVRKTFSGMAFYIDKAAGSLLGVVGVKLVGSAILDDSRI